MQPQPNENVCDIRYHAVSELVDEFLKIFRDGAPVTSQTIQKLTLALEALDPENDAIVIRCIATLTAVLRSSAPKEFESQLDNVLTRCSCPISAVPIEVYSTTWEWAKTAESAIQREAILRLAVVAAIAFGLVPKTIDSVDAEKVEQLDPAILGRALLMAHSADTTINQARRTLALGSRWNVIDLFRVAQHPAWKIAGQMSLFANSIVAALTQKATRRDWRWPIAITAVVLMMVLFVTGAAMNRPEKKVDSAPVAKSEEDKGTAAPTNSYSGRALPEFCRGKKIVFVATPLSEPLANRSFRATVLAELQNFDGDAAGNKKTEKSGPTQIEILQWQWMGLGGVLPEELVVSEQALPWISALVEAGAIEADYLLQAEVISSDCHVAKVQLRLIPISKPSAADPKAATKPKLVASHNATMCWTDLATVTLECEFNVACAYDRQEFRRRLTSKSVDPIRIVVAELANQASNSTMTDALMSAVLWLKFDSKDAENIARAKEILRAASHRRPVDHRALCFLAALESDEGYNELLQRFPSLGSDKELIEYRNFKEPAPQANRLARWLSEVTADFAR